jgi:hypothetical protein
MCGAFLKMSAVPNLRASQKNDSPQQDLGWNAIRIAGEMPL